MLCIFILFPMCRGASIEHATDPVQDFLACRLFNLIRQIRLCRQHTTNCIRTLFRSRERDPYTRWKPRAQSHEVSQNSNFQLIECALLRIFMFIYSGREIPVKVAVRYPAATATAPRFFTLKNQIFRWPSVRAHNTPDEKKNSF